MSILTAAIPSVVRAADAPVPQAALSLAEKFAAGAATIAPPLEDAQTRTANAEDMARKKALAAKKRADASRARAKAHEETLAVQRKADEAEMLARAKAEAVERDAEQKRADLELAAAVDAATAARAAAADAARTAADDAAKQVKAEMAERERIEEAEAVRRVADNRKREQDAADAATRDALASERREALASELRAKDALAEAALETERRVMTAKREAETLQLAARLKEARRLKAADLERVEQDHHDAQLRADNERKATLPAAEREHQAALSAASPTSIPAAVTAAAIQPVTASPLSVTASPSSVTASPLPVAASSLPGLGDAANALVNSSATRASILLVLKPGTYGIRRFNQAQADPVLCLGETCYISQGANAPATPMPRSRALGAGNTLGARAGACRMQLACIFRDVDVGRGIIELQPVDLHVLRHDRREMTRAAVDASCKVTDSSLVCASAVDAASYRAWIVPEATARLAGGSALTTALQSQLVTQRAAAN